MHATYWFRRIALIATVAMPGVVAMSSAAQAVEQKFQASSSFAIVASHGNHNELTGAGNASPGGPFTMTALIHQVGNGDASGIVTFDFDNGDTLTFYHEVEWVPEMGLLIGPYVVIDGTGRLEGASGSGTWTVDPAGDGTGVLWLDGTLTR